MVADVLGDGLGRHYGERTEARAGALFGLVLAEEGAAAALRGIKPRAYALAEEGFDSVLEGREED